MSIKAYIGLVVCFLVACRPVRDSDTFRLSPSDRARIAVAERVLKRILSEGIPSDVASIEPTENEILTSGWNGGRIGPYTIHRDSRGLSICESQVLKSVKTESRLSKFKKFHICVFPDGSMEFHAVERGLERL